MEVENPLAFLRVKRDLFLFPANWVETARKKRDVETLDEMGRTRGGWRSKPVVVAIL